MQKLLFHRTLRQLKSHAFRYVSLFLLVVTAMAIVIGVVGGAQSVVSTVEKCANQNHLEDGQFSVFVPLSDKEIAEIESSGITLEANFFLDFVLEDTSTLRIMKNRERINQVEIYLGHAAENKNEIVLERIFATAHGYTIGDQLIVGDHSFTVCGIGTSSDYDACLRNMSDMSADGKVFGTAFMTAPAYRDLLTSEKAIGTESYCYSYLLGETASNQELKDYLKELKANPDDVQDVFFQEFVKNKTEERDNMLDDIAKLIDGIKELDNAISKLRDGTADLNDGIHVIYSGLKTLNNSSNELTDASSSILSALQSLKTGTGRVNTSSVDFETLKAKSASMLSASTKLKQGLVELDESVNYEDFQTTLSSILTKSGDETSVMSSETQEMLVAMQCYLNATHAGITTAMDGANRMNEACEAFNNAIMEIPENMDTFKPGLAKLSTALTDLYSNYQYVDNAIIHYTDALQTIYGGFDEIQHGITKLDTGSHELANNSGEFRDGMDELREKTNELSDKYFAFEVDNLIDFVVANDNPRIKASSDDVLINVNVGTMAGVIVLILIAYVISVFTVHSIDHESAMIGTLYSLGLKPRQLMFHYAMLPVALCLAGGVFGTLLGFSRPMINLISGESIAYFSTPTLKIFYNPILIVCGIVVPPLTAYIVNHLVIRKRLSRPALALLRKEPLKTHTSNAGSTFNKLSFPRAFQIRQLLREKRSAFAILAGIFISLLILVMGINCDVLCRNVEKNNVLDTKYAYMYQLKYPEKTPPEDAHAVFIKGLKKEVLGYEMEINVIGLAKDNPFFPSISNQGISDLTIASSTASKFGLKIGDEVILRDEVKERMYAFRITSIVEYSPGLCAFMDITSMRELFEQDDDYYNALYTDHKLDIDSGRIYAVSTKSDVEKSATIFTDMMLSLVVTLTGSSIFILLIVLYQMTGVMVDRASTSISLMKVFGYRDREIRRLYLDGNFITIAIGMLFLLPLAKCIMDAIYPAFVANVACGTDYTWSPSLYALVYAGTLLSYLFIRTLLMKKLKRLTPSEALQDRE